MVASATNFPARMGNEAGPEVFRAAVLCVGKCILGRLCRCFARRQRLSTVARVVPRLQELSAHFWLLVIGGCAFQHVRVIWLGLLRSPALCSHCTEAFVGNCFGAHGHGVGRAEDSRFPGSCAGDLQSIVNKSAKPVCRVCCWFVFVSLGAKARSVEFCQ